MKNNPSDIDKQPQNGFGRVPDELFEPLCKLSHLSRSVFLLLCIKANRFQERSGKPVGELPHSVNAVAMWLGTSTGSIRRALRSLDTAGLIDYWRGGIRVRHYLPSMDHGDPLDSNRVDHGDPFLDHSDPPLDHGDPFLDHGDPPPGSPRSGKSPQPQQNTNTYLPLIGSEKVKVKDREVVEGADPPLLPFVSKKKKSKSAPKKKREDPTNHLLRFNGKGGGLSEFEGPGRQRFRELVYERYSDLGQPWIDATFNSCAEWCEDNPEHMEPIKSHYKFLLKWFNREAKSDRKRGKK